MKEGKKRKNIINTIIIVMIFSIMIWFGIEKYTDIKIGKKEIIETKYNKENLNIQYNIEKEVEENKTNTISETIKEYPKQDIINQYKGYEVAAKLEIPSIELEIYVLKQYSVEALNVSVTKFWGANPNEIGNFCIAGHNFKKMFRNLKKLQIGNRLYISDNIIGKIEYEIYDIYKVQPEDVSCLSQETNGKREVTLITCTNDSKERIIVKARELKS